MRKSYWMVGIVLALGCNETGPGIAAPTNLFYLLEASGDPDSPAGVLLTWDPVSDPDLEVYNIYSSPDGVTYDLRGSTTSISYHDVGYPDLFYFVSAVSVDGDESDGSEIVEIDERLKLESPNSLNSISLDGAIHLAWEDNAFQNEPTGFSRYRVYSSGYTLGNVDCDTDWSLEGTTVSPEFLVTALTNGLPRCFAVSAESIEGWESLWSPVRADTPRPDARNVVMYRTGADITVSGFSFFMDTNNDNLISVNELGLVLRGDRTDLDFRIVDAGGDLFFEPVRSGTGVVQYANQPVDDLTSIDLAPVQGFLSSAIQAVPGYGYVFEMDGGDGFARYGAARVTHVGADFLIFDWSYQTDPGNPELSIRGGLPTDLGSGITIKGVR